MASDRFPVWSPDGRRMLFESNRGASQDLYIKDFASGGDELLVKHGNDKVPTDWSADGKYFVYQEVDVKTQIDLWVVALEGDRKPFPFLRTEFNEWWGRLSPVPDNQGRLWMAYESDETGRNEIYLRPLLPGSPSGAGGTKLRVSTGGGANPKWRRDGRELFYFSSGKLMAVDVKLGASVEIGRTHPLFDLPDEYQYEPFPDGQRFIVIKSTGEPEQARINVVLNWQAELTEKSK